MEQVQITPFLEKLSKAGTGEGSRGGHIIGHDKSGKPIYEGSGERKPYPGEEEHKMSSEGPKKETFVPSGGWESHYTDKETPGLSGYKQVVKLFKKEGLDFEGHITFDKKTGNIEGISPQGDQAIKKLKEKYSLSNIAKEK